MRVKMSKFNFQEKSWNTEKFLNALKPFKTALKIFLH